MSPARSPPAEGFVEPSTAPWRVFDTQSEQVARDQGKPNRKAPDGEHGGIQPLTMAALAAAVLIAGLAIFVAIGGPGGQAAGPAASALALQSAPGEAGIGAVVVDVVGAVVAPGVYRLGAGARVRDAIDAAGGFGPRVDAGRVAVQLNLAATLTDGQQIRVPSRDDPAGATAGSGTGGGTGGGPGALIDLNAATQSELESLPGIGPVTAGKILQARATAPFRTIDELRERGLVGEKTFDRLRTLVTVG